MAHTIVLTKAGPRLVDLYIDEEEISLVVNGPGMLFEKLELMTNRSAVEGATVAFYRTVADGLAATVDCPAEPLATAPITVEPHRLGAELSIGLGSMSMYQNEVRLRTTTGESFRALIDRALGERHPFRRDVATMAALVAHRATGHQEHHAHAKPMKQERDASDGGNNHHGHGGHG
jgi:hypothetical protein